VHLVVGDITGHGVLAALQVGRFRATLRALLRSGVTPAMALRTLSAVNDDAPVYASIGLVSIDRANRAEIITAGHPDVIVSRRGGHERIRSGDPLVGVELRDADPTPVAIAELRPDDVVCLYSDGLIERRDEDLDTAIERVARWVDEHPASPAIGLRDHADRLVRDLRGERPADDVLVVMARVTR
jgi:serine phosphatase RsbU (regulator of sigma subunit)